MLSLAKMVVPPGIADYGISRVRYAGPGRLAQLEVRELKGGYIGPPRQVSREHLIRAIRQGFTFVTTPQNSLGRYVIGMPVDVVAVEGASFLRGAFLRPGPSEAPSDDLGRIAEF
jgi:hypothetical protein